MFRIAIVATVILVLLLLIVSNTTLALTAGNYCVVFFELPFTDNRYHLPSWMWGLYPIMALGIASVTTLSLWITLGVRRFRIHGNVKWRIDLPSDVPNLLDWDWGHRNHTERIAPTSERSKGMYALRLVALAGTTFFGIYLSASIFVLATAFNHTARHFPMFITTQDFAKTFLAGVGFLASAIAYVALVKKTERTSPRSR